MVDELMVLTVGIIGFGISTNVLYKSYDIKSTRILSIIVHTISSWMLLVSLVLMADRYGWL